MSFTVEDCLDTRPVLPLFIEVLGGYGLAAGNQPRPWDSGPLLDAAVGFRGAGCSAGVDVGLRYRRGLSQQNEELHALFLFIDVEYMSHTEADYATAGGSYARCDRPAPPRAAMPPVDGGLDVQVPRVEVDVHVDVEIEPVVIEVPLGLWLFGGALRLNVRADSLPIANLPGAGFVEVRLVGPPAALGSAEAEVRAALGPNGVHVDGWARTATGDNTVRAIFTLWPSGTGPASRQTH